MKPALLTLLFLTGTRLSAQEACPCVHQLDTLIDLVSRNYAGYYDKVLSVDRGRYNTFVDSLRNEALTAFVQDTCTALRSAYCRYFKDRRLGLVRPPEMLAKHNTTDPKPLLTAWTADSLRKHLDGRRDASHELEGIWKLGGYEFGLLPVDSSERYQGIVMSSPYPHWKVGMVKFTLAPAGSDSVQVDYWRTDMKFTKFNGFRSTGHMAMGDIGVMHRMLPATADTVFNKAFELTHGNELQWRMLDDSTLYIKAGVCMDRVQLVIDSLVKADTTLLDRIPAWIIDVRRNGYGEADVFRALMPYLSTRPYTDSGFKYWMSPANTSTFGTTIRSRSREKGRKAKRRSERWSRSWEEHPNTWSETNYRTYPTGPARSAPQRIAVLTDTTTAGRAELVLLHMRGSSDKVTVFGQHTAGAVDYGHMIYRSLGKEDMLISIPTTRRNWLGKGSSYNNTGIQPDVVIGPDDGDPLRFVQRYWTSH